MISSFARWHMEQNRRHLAQTVSRNRKKSVKAPIYMTEPSSVGSARFARGQAKSFAHAGISEKRVIRSVAVRRKAQ